MTDLDKLYQTVVNCGGYAIRGGFEFKIFEEDRVNILKVRDHTGRDDPWSEIYRTNATVE